MVDDGLVRYIKERLGEGYKDSYIKEVLRNHGHEEEKIEEAFHYIHRNHRKVPIIPILILLLIVAVLLFFFLQHEQKGPTDHKNIKPLDNLTNQTIHKKSPDIITLAQQLKEESVNKSPDEIYYETVNTSVIRARTVADGILICSVNENLEYKNYCLQEMASKRMDPSYCKVIGDVKQRDECYLQLILKGEDQYCSKLILEDSKRVCKILLGTV